MNINSTLLKQLRTEKHWSQEQLSEACGLNIRTVQRVENTGKASLETARSLASVFEVDAKEFELMVTHTKSMTPKDAIQSGLVDFADFTSNASQSAYWWFLAFVFLTAAIATVIHEKAYIVVGLLLLMPFIAVGQRRLNDAGQSGWWQLMWLVPYGQVVVLYLMTMDGQETLQDETNKGESNPLKTS